ncbi:DUF317 domain-containing protein [Streptomyces hirsutus]|uniref:DUF317 domain-containing protein n=1 Tax=Streptomyces hirsutus TaxID=35620 RepID=UPI00365BB88C
MCSKLCWAASPTETSGIPPSAAPPPKRLSPRPPAPSPTPAGSTPWTDAGSAGRPPRATRESSSTPSPPQQTASVLSTWTLWAGPSINQPTWAMNASAYTPAPLIANLTRELAHGIGTRQQRPQLTSTPPAAAPALPKTRPSPRR